MISQSTPASTPWCIVPSLEWSMKDTFVDYMNTFRAPSYSVLNLSLGREFDDGVTLFLDIRNLTGEKYVSNFSSMINWSTSTAAQRTVFFPGDERSAYGGIAFTF
ncbi:MAG: TonB-dependent receptor [Burkholderiales bacterium]|nr:MAG: TonB-dependent receptor [Burkholderiales bacterium]